VRSSRSRILASFISIKIAPSSGRSPVTAAAAAALRLPAKTGFARRASLFPSPLGGKAVAHVRAPGNSASGIFNRRQNLRALFCGATELVQSLHRNDLGIVAILKRRPDADCPRLSA
jgi:hypothetical protein